jgi:hypothetical protein
MVPKTGKSYEIYFSSLEVSSLSWSLNFLLVVSEEIVAFFDHHGLDPDPD